jgi:hypothetical protein
MSEAIRTYLKGHLYIPLRKFKNMTIKDYKKLRKGYGCHFSSCSKIAKHYILFYDILQDGYIEFETYLCTWHMRKLKRYRKP